MGIFNEKPDVTDLNTDSPKPTENVMTTRWALPYRILAFLLAAGFWGYYVGRHPFDATGGWRYLTNWGHSFNLLALAWALASSWLPGLRTKNPILPTALTIGTIVVILYWSLYMIDPALVNGAHPLPWYSEWYLHLGSTVTVYIEAICLNKAPTRPIQALGPVALVTIGYIAWVDLVVPRFNNKPCGLTTDTCGYPYPFLNDLSGQSRMMLYVGAGLGLLALCAALLTLWSKLRTPRDL